jgi:hypothetical protein
MRGTGAGIPPQVLSVLGSNKGKNAALAVKEHLSYNGVEVDPK